jgi:acetate---CoA ligase (ADP-forming)
MNQASKLEPMFEPRSVAVIGASEDPRRLGGRVLAYLKAHFPGPTYPVNSRVASVQGLAVFPSVRDLPEAPDLAIVAVPAHSVVKVIEECVAQGVRSAAILTSGFSEAGADGNHWQEQLRALARDAGIRLSGPNCAGVINIAHGLVGTYATVEVHGRSDAGVAVISQSGGLGITLWNACHRAGFGASFFMTTGNEVDISAAEALSYVVEREEVSTILLFLEAMNRPDLLYSASARARQLGKSIIAMKVGASERGAVAAVSHTASLAVPDQLAAALLDRAGIVRVRTITELVATASAIVTGRLPAGDRVGVITISGGTGVMITDEATELGLTLPPPSPEVASRIAARIPDFGSVLNPIDCTGNFVNDPDSFDTVLELVVTDDNFDAVCIAETAPAFAQRMCDSIRSVFAVNSKPIAVYSADPEIVQLLGSRGVPAYNDAVLMTKVVANLVALARRRADAPEPPPLLACSQFGDRQAEIWAAEDTRRLLKRYSIPLVEELSAVGVEQAVAAANRLRYPVALKLDPSVCAHKSDVGGLQLGVQSDSDVVATMERFSATLAASNTETDPTRLAVVVQAMVPAGIELVVGGTRHPALGPAVTVGMGGNLVDIIRESSTDLAPLSAEGAGRLVDRLCGGRLVSAGRGLTGIQRGSLIQVVVAVGRLLADHSGIRELDLNPLIATDEGVVSVDSLIIGPLPALATASL